VDAVKQNDILIRPYVTEKTLNLLSGTPAQKYRDGNKIEFIVHRQASKEDVKAAFEERFEVKVERVWTKIQKDGKHAIIKLAEGYSAEDVGMRVGVF
jgi:large subunit ribosomal protein L23